MCFDIHLPAEMFILCWWDICKFAICLNNICFFSSFIFTMAFSVLSSYLRLFPCLNVSCLKRWNVMSFLWFYERLPYGAICWVLIFVAAGFIFPFNCCLSSGAAKVAFVSFFRLNGDFADELWMVIFLCMLLYVQIVYFTCFWRLLLYVWSFTNL